MRTIITKIEKIGVFDEVTRMGGLHGHLEYNPPDGFVKDSWNITGELLDKALGTGTKYRDEFDRARALGEDGFVDEAVEIEERLKNEVLKYWEKVKLYDPETDNSVEGWLPKKEVLKNE